jgi:hypothetical protein
MAERLMTICAHARRLKNSDTRMRQACSKLSDPDIEKLKALIDEIKVSSVSSLTSAPHNLGSLPAQSPAEAAPVKSLPGIKPTSSLDAPVQPPPGIMSTSSKDAPEEPAPRIRPTSSVDVPVEPPPIEPTGMKEEQDAETEFGAGEIPGMFLDAMDTETMPYTPYRASPDGEDEADLDRDIAAATPMPSDKRLDSAAGATPIPAARGDPSTPSTAIKEPAPTRHRITGKKQDTSSAGKGGKATQSFAGKGGKATKKDAAEDGKATKKGADCAMQIIRAKDKSYITFIPIDQKKKKTLLIQCSESQSPEHAKVIQMVCDEMKSVPNFSSWQKNRAKEMAKSLRDALIT